MSSIQTRELSSFRNLTDVFAKDLPTLPLFQEPVSLVQQSDIVNVSESPGPAGPLWNAEEWVVEVASPRS